MSKVASKYKVCVEVAEPWLFANTTTEYLQKRRREKADELASQIKRHCDDVGQPWIETEWKCSHCGYAWETDSTGEPVCCGAAQAEFQAAKATA